MKNVTLGINWGPFPPPQHVITLKKIWSLKVKIVPELLFTLKKYIFLSKEQYIRFDNKAENLESWNNKKKDYLIYNNAHMFSIALGLLGVKHLNCCCCLGRSSPTLELIETNLHK